MYLSNTTALNKLYRMGKNNTHKHLKHIRETKLKVFATPCTPNKLSNFICIEKNLCQKTVKSCTQAQSLSHFNPYNFQNADAVNTDVKMYNLINESE